MTNRIYIQNQNCFNSPKGTENQYATNCMIILGVTCILMMNQDIKHLIGNEVQEPSVAQVFIKYDIPRLLGEHEFDIFINGFCLCTTEDFIGEIYSMHLCVLRV